MLMKMVGGLFIGLTFPPIVLLRVAAFVRLIADVLSLGAENIQEAVGANGDGHWSAKDNLRGCHLVPTRDPPSNWSQPV
jgi:hypothetical protein